MLGAQEALLPMLLGLQLISTARAEAIWPSPAYDELEDLMFLTSGYGNRNFMTPLVPCTFAPNPGHSVAGGFLRTAFHDMAGADVGAGTDGLDASIGFELDGSVFIENTGLAFNNTLSFISRFYSPRASMSDLLALATYASVRACGGPSVPLRAGRIDATKAGVPGVPDPKDSVTKLTTDFARMGLTATEGIQLVACGHTLGGVHSAEHPTFVLPNSTTLGVKDFDATNNTFDHSVVTQYLDGTTQNPLIVGPDVDARSDLRVFDMDGNATVSAMADKTSYANTCASILAKMIDTVPASVTLTDVITAYPVKPADLQLNVAAGGDKLVFSGAIRVWTSRVSKSSISSLKLVYKDRFGAVAGHIDASAPIGDSAGFDDSFTFYGFNTTIAANTSISSFVVVVTLTSGSTTTYDNSGKGFKVQDKILDQKSYSSITAPDASGNQHASIVAAVRSGLAGDVDITVNIINKMGVNNLPTISKRPVVMTKVCDSSYYSFYSATFDVPSAAVNGTKYDLSVADASDSFKSYLGLQAKGADLPCGGSSSSTTTTASTSGMPPKSTATSTSSTGSTSWSKSVKPASTTSSSTAESAYYTTTVVTSYETYCPFATQFIQNGKTYTVTSETMLTITDCPCTITVPGAPGEHDYTLTSESTPMETTPPSTVTQSARGDSFGYDGLDAGTSAGASSSVASALAEAASTNAAGTSPASTSQSSTPVASAIAVFTDGASKFGDSAFMTFFGVSLAAMILA